MDNSIAKCAACGADMNLGDTSCQKCGEPVTSTQRKGGQMARLLNKFAGKTQNSPPSEASTPLTVYAGEPLIAFASGLPAWSIEPPTVVVRRKAKT